MFRAKLKSLTADPDSASALVHRLLTEQAFGQWRRYAVAFALMALSAAMTALGAYLIGDVINAAYVDKNLPGIIALALVTAVIFMIKGIATYGQAVMLSRIGNRIVALNQQRMFTALIRQNVGFFSDRHSSEFMMRLTTGATAASAVINLLVTAIGRDLLSLIGLVTVMAVQDPIMSLFSFVVAPPAFIVLRKMIRRVYRIARNQFTGGTRIVERGPHLVEFMPIGSHHTWYSLLFVKGSSGALPSRGGSLRRRSRRWPAPCIRTARIRCCSSPRQRRWRSSRACPPAWTRSSARACRSATT